MLPQIRRVELWRLVLSAATLAALAELVQDPTRSCEFLLGSSVISAEDLLTFVKALGAAPGLVGLDLGFHHTFFKMHSAQFVDSCYRLSISDN